MYKTTPKSIAILASTLGLSYFAYRTLTIYLTRRKYRHIPGPPADGFVSSHTEFPDFRYCSIIFVYIFFRIVGFYMGNLPEIGKALKNGKIMDDKFLEW